MTTTAQIFAHPVTGVAGFNTTANFGTNGTTGFGLTNVHPVTGEYIVQFIPSSALNNNLENALAHQGLISGNIAPTVLVSVPHNQVAGVPVSGWAQNAFFGIPHSLGLSQYSGLQQNLGIPTAAGLASMTPYGNTFNTGISGVIPTGLVGIGAAQLAGAFANNITSNPWNTTGVNPNVATTSGYSSPAAFVTPSGWQNIPTRQSANSPSVNSATQGLTSALVRYVTTDMETIIECYIPGTNTENLELTVIGNEIRVRQIQVTQTDTSNTTTFLSLALPHYSDGNQVHAQSLGDILRITCPTRKDIAGQVKKIKPTRVK